MLNRRKGNAKSLNKYNKERREKTLISIREAVNELQALGYEPTIPRIREITKLSPGAFQQEHIQELMLELKIGKYAKLTMESNKKIDYDDYLNIYNKLLKKEKQINNQKQQIYALTKKYDEQVKENEILRMKVYELQLEKDLLFPIQSNN